MILRWCNSIAGMKHIRHELWLTGFTVGSRALSLAGLRALTGALSGWFHNTFHDLICCVISAVRSVFIGSRQKCCMAYKRQKIRFIVVLILKKRIYSWNTSEDEFVCIYLGWLGCVCADQGEQRRRCRRPAGWYEVLQSSVHVQLRPPCSPNPAAETPGHLKERLQTSHSEKKEGELISGSAWTM